MAKIMVTNNGPHPPEKWAMATAEAIFDIDDSELAGDHMIQAQKLQLSIAEALMPHHDEAQKSEAKKLKADAKHFESDHDPSDFVDGAIKDILKVSKGTPWEAHFAKKEVQEAAREMIARHFQTVQHIHRLWHADSNPSCEFARAYKMRFNR